MYLPHWLWQLSQRWAPRGSNRHSRSCRVPTPNRRRVRPRIEVLEERLTPASNYLAFAAAPYDFTLNQPSGAFAVQLQDIYGHAVNATSSVTINLQSSSSTGQFLNLSGKALSTPSVTIAAGSNTAYFEYEDSQLGNPQITAKSTDGTLSALRSVNVSADLVFTTPPQTLAPGQISKPITVQLQDPSGKVVKALSNVTVSLSSYPGTGQLLDTSGHPLPSPNNVTISAGNSSASFEYENSAVGYGYINASTGNSNVSQNENIRYSLAFTTSPQVIPANTPSGKITIQLQDASGKAVNATSSVTLNLQSSDFTGQFLDTTGKALSTPNITIAAGSNSASFEYKGTQYATITAMTSDYLSQTQQVEGVGIPMAFITPPQWIQLNTASRPFTLKLDQALTSSVTIKLSSDSSSGQFLSTSGTALPNSSITIAAGQTEASFEYKDTSYGSPTITAQSSDGSLYAFQQEDVGMDLAFTTAAQTLAPSQTSGTITVRLQNSSGTAITAPAAENIYLSSSSYTGKFLNTAGSPITTGYVTIAKGSSSASFKYSDTQGGSPSLTAALDLGGEFGPFNSLPAAPWTVSTSQQETVTTPSFYNLTNVLPLQPMAINQAQLITVQLQAGGNAYTTPTNMTVKLSSSSSGGKFLDTSGKALANSSITIPAGSSTATFEYEDTVEGIANLTLTYPGPYGYPLSNPLQVNIGGITLAFSTASRTITAGKPSSTITVQLEDSQGKVVKAESDMSLYLSSNSSTGEFLDTTGKKLSSNNLTLAKGSSSASFEFEDTVGGQPTLNVYSYTSVSTLSASQQETVNGPYNVMFVSAGQDLKLNTASQPISVELVTDTGAPAVVTSAVGVKLTSSSTGGTFLTTSGSPLSNATLTIPANSSSASFEYKDSKIGLPTLTAAENGFQSQQAEAVGVSLVFTSTAQTVHAGKTSTPITVQLEDSSGHAFSAPSDLSLYVSGTIPGVQSGVQFLDTSGNPLAQNTIKIAKGTSAANFEFSSTWGGKLLITASTSGYYNGSSTGAVPPLSATQTETVNGLASLVFTTSAQTLTAGQTSNLVTVQLEDNWGNATAAPTGGLTIDLSLGVNNGTVNGGYSFNSKFFDSNGNPLPTNSTSPYYSYAVIIMPAGSKTVSFKFETTTEGQLYLSAQVPNGISGAQTETINPAAPSSVAFLTQPQTLPTGVPSGSITVEVKDKYGNIIPSGSTGLTIKLSSTSSGGKFLSQSGDPLSNSSFTIPKGAVTGTFEYQDSNTGTPTLTVTADGVSGTQQEKITVVSSEIHVSNTNDNGTGSLRAAITAADANPGSTIVFDSGAHGAINLLTALPAITANTNILGPGANVLTIEPNSLNAATFGGLVIGYSPQGLVFFPPEPTVLITGLTVANFKGTGINNYGSLTLRQVQVSNNQAPPANNSNQSSYYPTNTAGGISNESGGILTVLDSTINGNTTTGNYAAAGIDSEGISLTLINSTIANNVENNDYRTGGIGVYGGAAYIASSTITGNTASQQQGGLGYYGGTSGGGIDANGGVWLYNTIVAGNKGAINNPTDVSGTFISQGYNLIGTANKLTSGGFISTDKVGTTASPINAKLGKLQNNGGPTLTIGLLSGSPAINAGSSVNAPATDQRGDQRPTSGAIDIGAFQGTTTSTPVPLLTAGNPSIQSVTTGTALPVSPSVVGTPTPSAGNLTSSVAAPVISTSPTLQLPTSSADHLQQILEDVELMEQSLLSGNLLVFLESWQEYQALAATGEHE